MAVYVPIHPSPPGSPASGCWSPASCERLRLFHRFAEPLRISASGFFMPAAKEASHG